MIKRRISSTLLPHCHRRLLSADCSLLRRVGAQQPVSRRGIATDFSRCGYLATGNFASSGGILCGNRRTARNGSGGLHQGIRLVISRSSVPVFRLIAMGKGSFMQGIRPNPHPFTPEIRSWVNRSLIGAAFTGLILVNTFYWCTNQGIVQRTLASKSLAEGQKGALLTAVLKMLDPLVLVLQGSLRFIYQDLPKADMAYPTLVNNVLPVPLVGFFGAVLFGAVISTFNGFLNSASTLFSIIRYARRIINQNAEPQQLVTVGRKFGFFIAIVSVLVAPWIANAPQGL